MEQNNNKPAFVAVHPGSTLLAELEERGISQKEFAKQIGMQATHLNELIHGKRNITMQVADKLQEALGISSQIWVNMQTQYNYDVKELERQSQQKPVTLNVSISDTSLLKEIKQAISMLKGVGRIAVF